jgi:uncharacterized membrane protein
MKIAKDVSRLFTPRRQPSGLPIVAAAGAGAALMYLLDPDRGARRRAIVRDKGARAGRRVGMLFSKAARDLGFRTRGALAETRARLRHEEPNDALLTERVRATLGRAVSHPHAVQVDAHDGCVTLRGPVLADERQRAVECVEAVRGVREVACQLEPHAPEERVPALQGERLRDGDRIQRSRERWSPATRVAMGAAGAGLLAAGAAKRGRLGLALGAAGAALLVRDVADRPLRRVLGIGAGTCAVDFHKTLHVRAPIDQVYALFTDVEQFPRFMSHVRAVERVGPDRYRWVAEGPARVPVTWEAEVTQREPNRAFAWRSADGAAIKNCGVVRFEEDGAGTRLDIQMSYNPPAGVVGHLLAAIFGADPKHALDEDMVRFQSLLERGKTTAHHHEVRVSDLEPNR